MGCYPSGPKKSDDEGKLDTHYARTGSVGERVWITDTDGPNTADGVRTVAEDNISRDSDSIDFVEQNPGLPAGDVVDSSSIQPEISPASPDDCSPGLGITRELSVITEDTTLRGTIRSVLIDRKNIDLESEIGRGSCGTVYRGKLLADGVFVMNIAVKTLHTNTALSSEAKENFLKEATIMVRFNHQNVMELIGVCFDPAWGPMTVLPYMGKGDLRSFIADRNREHNLRNLLKYGLHVAQGMAYLAKQKVIHRDLAARNCMVDDQDGNLNIKVADFGLTKLLEKKNFYLMKNANVAMPIKWMAIECLQEFMFTIKSDVWSFGVLLWELVTLGDTPFINIKPSDLVAMLNNGRRLARPEHCPDVVYDTMQSCWNNNPDDRPSFKDLVVTLKSTVAAVDQTVEHSATAGLLDEEYNRFVDPEQFYRPLSKGQSNPVVTVPPSSSDGYLRPWKDG